MGIVLLVHIIDKKSLRKSTAVKSIEAEHNRKEREAKAQMLKDIAAKKNVSEVRRLTQEELLAEAKLTEEINLRSLGRLSILIYNNKSYQPIGNRKAHYNE